MIGVGVGLYRGRSEAPLPTLLSGLQHYYLLGEASGGRLDSVGGNTLVEKHGSNLSFTGQISRAAGVGGVGYAVDLPEAPNIPYLEAPTPYTTGFGATASMTMCGWVYTGPSPLVGGRSVGGWWGNDGTTNKSFWLGGWAGKGSFSVRNAANTAESGAVTTANFPVDSWIFVCGWNDHTGGTVNYQQNNGTIYSAASTGGIRIPTSGALRLGKGWDGQYISGRLQGVGIWNRVLTPTERTALYNAGSGLFHPFA